MKYRNPKTGEEFSNIFRARTAECAKHRTCEGCPVNFCNSASLSCTVWADEHPDEAARRLGLEVIEEEHTAPKPRLAEVLGVEVGEKFTITYEDEIPVESVHFFVNDDGHFLLAGSGSHGSCVYGAASLLCNAINHPESIIRAPRLTEIEIERCRVYGGKYLTRDSDSPVVAIWESKPDMMEAENGEWRRYVVGVSGAPFIGEINARLFPSVQCGDLIEVPEPSIPHS